MKKDFTAARGEYLYGHVRGLSMWPALIPGDILRAWKVRAGKVVPGEILVLGHGGDSPVVHRLLSMREEPGDRVILITAGDRSGEDPERMFAVDDELLRVAGVLRRGRWSPPPFRLPSFICRLPRPAVRLHCAAVRRLFW